MKSFSMRSLGLIALLGGGAMLSLVMAWPHMGSAQEKTDPKDQGKELAAQVRDLQAKVIKLEDALKKTQPVAAADKGGMPMGAGDKGGMPMSTGDKAKPGMAMVDDKMASMEKGGMGKGGMGTDAMEPDEMMSQMMQNMGQMMQMMGKMKGKSMSSMGDKQKMGTGMMGEKDKDMKGMEGMDMKDKEMKGMKGTDMKDKGMAMMDMDKQEMVGMMGMGGMGQKGPGMGKMQMATALPGFPGASHIYHIGASGFFLDHPDHIKLTTKQLATLNGLKEKALLEKSSSQRKIDEAEQELWTLTASDKPDATKIDAKVRDIEKLRGDQRLPFIRSVGEAAQVLTDEQRQALLGNAADKSDKPDPHAGHKP